MHRRDYMGFRFRKRIRLAKGVYLNLGNKSSSLSVGKRGATMNISKKGVRDTFSIPGTGLSYQTKAKGCLWLILALPSFALLALWLVTC